MIAARLDRDLELRVVKIALALNLSTSDLVRIGVGRVIEEFDQTGGIAVRPAADPDPDGKAARAAGIPLR